MESDELGTRGGASLIILSGCSIILSSRVTLNILSKKSIAFTEIFLLNQIPLIFGICSWLIILLGPSYAAIDLISTFYKFFSVIVFFIYILKVLCNQSDYDYGQLQHQLILIKELSVFGFTLQIDECRKINVYVKLQIAGLLCYSLLILARIGIGINMMLKGGDFGSWNGNAWSALRVFDMVVNVLYSTLSVFW